MVSGAPKPGGYNHPQPGGVHMIAPGGTNLNERYQRRLLAGYPDYDLSQGDGAGGQVAVTRSVANLRQGRASASAPTYLWTLPTKPAASTAVVTNGTTATASFTPTNAGVHVFQCAVTFSDGTVITKSVTYIAS